MEYYDYNINNINSTNFPETPPFLSPFVWSTTVGFESSGSTCRKVQQISMNYQKNPKNGTFPPMKPYERKQMSTTIVKNRGLDNTLS